MHPREYYGSVVDDADADAGNARPADHQAEGKREQGPLRDPEACWKVQNKGRAIYV